MTLYWYNIKTDTVNPEYFISMLFSYFRTRQLPYKNKMHAEGTKQIRESAAISDCTNISCVRKVGKPRIRKLSAYEIFWIQYNVIFQGPVNYVISKFDCTVACVRFLYKLGCLWVFFLCVCTCVGACGCVHSAVESTATSRAQSSVGLVHKLVPSRFI